jgi:dolichyl-phosphate-mannose--protein O-mannosyl transferase
MGFVVLLTLIAGLVRFYDIDKPSEIVFDEVHFGGFASKYITSRFFFDVHPPRKFLISLSRVNYTTDSLIVQCLISRKIDDCVQWSLCWI